MDERSLGEAAASGQPREATASGHSREAEAEVQTVSDLARLLRQLRRREARQQGGTQLTYRELAAKTGWSRGIIGEYFGGRILPPTDRFDVLIRLLGASPAEQGTLATARDRVEEQRRSGSSQTVSGPPAPRQLPTRVRGFAGRTAEIADLDRVFDESRRASAVMIAVVSGTAGVGKTALAVHWAHRIADRFPDGQLYVNLRGFDPVGPPMRPAEALRGFLDACRMPADQIPDGVPAQTGLYRSLLAGRRVLVVLDNARDADQVRPLLPGAPGCLVVVTSRNTLSSLVAVEGARPVTLGLLAAAEARTFLASRLGPDRVSAEPQPVEEIIDQCARLPLALAVVAARAVAHRSYPLAALAAQLHASGGLDAFADDDPAGNVRSVFSWSYRGLSARAARLFRLLGVHCGPDIGVAAAASLAGMSSARVRPLLAELVRAHLVTEHAPGRYGFHDLLRAYATELAHTRDPETAQRAALRRALDHYLHTAHTAALVIYPYRDPVRLAPHDPAVTPEVLTDHGQARDWFTAERPVLVALIEQAARTGFDVHAWQLAWTLVDFFQWRGLWQDWAATQSIGLAATRRLGDRAAEADAHRGLARPYARLGRHGEARVHLRQALDLFGELDDGVGQAYTHFVLCLLYEREGRHRDALRHAQQCLDLFRAAGHRVGQAIALNNVGWYHALLGDHRRALTYCQQALTLQGEIGDRHAQANTWDSIGYAHRHLGRHEQAAACYRRAADLFRELGDRDSEAAVLARLGDAHGDAGEMDAARDVWRQAVHILDELGRPDVGGVRAKLTHPAP